jgi:hypothetical protein
MFRFGSRTSPAVKVMLFQASAENRVGLRHADGDEQAEPGGRGEPVADLLQRPARGPEVGEVGADRVGVPADQDAEHDERDERTGLGGGEDVLHQLAELEPARVHEGEERDHEHGDQLRGRQRDGVLAPEMDRLDQVPVQAHRRHQHPEVLGEPDRDRRDGAGLDHDEQRPAVEEAGQRPERLAQIDVLATRLRHHRRQLAVREGRREREQAGDQPDHQEPAGRSDLAGDVGRDDEDARPDHRAGHDHRGVDQSEPADESALGLDRHRQIAGPRHGIYFSPLSPPLSRSFWSTLCRRP